MHDYIKEVKERLKYEKNKDVLALYTEVTYNTRRHWIWSWFYKVGKEWKESDDIYKLQDFLSTINKKIESLKKKETMKQLDIRVNKPYGQDKEDSS
jgi:hypothetical protein